MSIRRCAAVFVLDCHIGVRQRLAVGGVNYVARNIACLAAALTNKSCDDGEYDKEGGFTI
ncbi:MAG: hypothetical protein QGG85_08380 [Candidatus Marinimicrobia bacterium]|nr:hypothetical protein [Candidatus Neomarinimicrobiota bacterium]